MSGPRDVGVCCCVVIGNEDVCLWRGWRSVWLGVDCWRVWRRSESGWFWDSQAQYAVENLDPGTAIRNQPIASDSRLLRGDGIARCRLCVSGNIIQDNIVYIRIDRAKWWNIRIIHSRSSRLWNLRAVNTDVTVIAMVVLEGSYARSWSTRRDLRTYVCTYAEEWTDELFVIRD